MGSGQSGVPHRFKVKTSTPRSEFRRPSGTQAPGVSDPGDKSPGYYQVSLRDAFWPAKGHDLKCLSAFLLEY
jgi:hypothetical protein